MVQAGINALRLANVSKSYGRVRALENLSFTVAEGRFFVLFGPSSVGKTTTLRTIAGLVTPDQGRVEIFGKDWTHRPIAGRGVSMVFQSFALYPHLTAYENFAYPLVEEGVPRAEIDRRVKETAAMLKLDKKIDRKPSTLEITSEVEKARDELVAAEKQAGELTAALSGALAEHALGRRAATRRSRPFPDPAPEGPAPRRAADQPRRQAAP